MIISRGVSLMKVATNITKQKCSSNITQIRNSGHGVTYRDCPPAPRAEQIVASLCGGFMWWWVFWHMWHEWGHIVGEFPYPDASKWTDVELGIPPDNYD